MTPPVETERASCHDPKSLRCRRGSCVVYLSRCVCWYFFFYAFWPIFVSPDCWVFFLTFVGCSFFVCGLTVSLPTLTFVFLTLAFGFLGRRASS